jgi:hypothetical protein
MANPSTPFIRARMDRGHLGAIWTPAQGNRLPPGVTFCIDNGCGPGKDGQPGTGYPGDRGYLELLSRMSAQARERCLFATAPDVLADAAATLERSEGFMRPIRGWFGLPVALVAQDGLEHLDVPWYSFDVLFIGGSTGWKLGPAAAELTAEAHRRGKWVHMGRVNTRQRLRYASWLGCDSADGTGMTRAPDKNLAQMLGWLGEVNGQVPLFTAATAGAVAPDPTVITRPGPAGGAPGNR